ncbi:hypothetical protein JD969_12460 [Planctomycetota bacterium]|nr:hypothetical protein JD969_12460 [Planctomycetota bacterium]
MKNHKLKNKKKPKKNQWWKKKRYWGITFLSLILTSALTLYIVYEIAKPNLPKSADQAIATLSTNNIYLFNHDEFDEYMIQTHQFVKDMSFAEQKKLAKNHSRGFNLYGDWLLIQQGRSYAFAKNQAERDAVVKRYIAWLKDLENNWSEEIMQAYQESSIEDWALMSPQEGAYLTALDEAASKMLGRSGNSWDIW